MLPQVLLLICLDFKTMQNTIAEIPGSELNGDRNISAEFVNVVTHYLIMMIRARWTQLFQRALFIQCLFD
jgi:hypothetical protein